MVKNTNNNKKAAQQNGRSQKNNNSRKQTKRVTHAATSYTIPAATMTRSQPRQATVSTTQSGSDNLDILSMTTGSHYPLGSVILMGAITAEASARLATLSRAYQRIRWNNIRFTIEGAFPTTCGGGYITCFVRDPTDSPPEDPREAVRWAMAQQHSSDNKWYDSSGLNVGRSPNLLFTSNGDGLRFSSPGNFYIISKGGPAQVGSLTVNFHWNVTLSEPTIETDRSGSSFTLKEDLVFPFVPDNGYFLLSRVTVPAPDPHGVTVEPVTLAELGQPNMAKGTYLSFPQPVVVTGMYNTGNDYIPLYVSGLVVTGEQKLAAVYILNSTEFYVAAQGVADPIPGFVMSDWHILSGGMGASLEPGFEIAVYANPTALVPMSVDIFTAHGKRKLLIPGKRIAANTPVNDQHRATVALSGER